MLTSDRTIGPKINARIPLTINPGISTEASQKHRPLTTRENSPRVKIFNGNDKVDRIGRINELINPIAIAASRGTAKLSVAKSTPGTAKSTISKLRAVASQVKTTLIILIP